MHSNSQSRNFAPFSILIDFRSDFSEILGKWPTLEYFWMFRYFIFIFFWHERLFQRLIVYANLEVILIRIASHEEEVHILAALQSEKRSAQKAESAECRAHLHSRLHSNSSAPLDSPTVSCCASLLLFTDSSVFLTFSFDIRSPPASQVSFSEKFFAQFDSSNFWMYGYFS